MNTTFDFLYMLIYIGPFAILRYYPFRDRLRISVKALVALYLVVIVIEAFLFVYLKAQPFWNITLTQIFRMGFMIFFAGLSFTLVKENFFKQLYIWLLTFAVAGLFFTNANFIEGRYFSETAKSVPHAVVVVVVFIQILLFFPWILKFIDRKIIPVMLSINGAIWNIIWPVPVLVLGGTFLATSSLELDQVSTPFYLIVRLTSFLTIICYSLVIAEALKKTSENATLRENMIMTDRQIDLERDHYHMLEEHIEASRRNQHDLKHHISVFKTLLENGEYDNLNEYLSQYEMTVPAESPVAFCQSYALNAIVNHYYLQAGKEEIPVDIQIKLPEKTGVADVDLCIIFGNLFENAVEACRRQKNTERFIRLSAAMAGTGVVITVDNSFEEQVIQEDGLFVSSKRLGKGIGTTSVKAIAEKYHGYTKFEYDGNVFRASVMLQGAK